MLVDLQIKTQIRFVTHASSHIIINSNANFGTNDEVELDKLTKQLEKDVIDSLTNCPKLNAELIELKETMMRNDNTFESLHKQRDELNVKTRQLLEEYEKINIIKKNLENELADAVADQHKIFEEIEELGEEPDAEQLEKLNKRNAIAGEKIDLYQSILGIGPYEKK